MELLGSGVRVRWFENHPPGDFYPEGLPGWNLVLALRGDGMEKWQISPNVLTNRLF
jgi:hypothetical protein